ncbi:Hypothetical_protein [Hexamita inflata]|uniref:Hypothetical_protein n=1 Tax=Hexamita inflata TaxID=28002 RepID=A0AA86V0Y2_9EUKA|nr:Hypothetical protein HINF_LOCUS4808 [Hexamita inflata]CAI9919969.1 Hypothetical protein HINF_LOCUS7614 [Hexamita inflata]CAI9971982.1 Hypothetical protein HINF_LOCUS59627 [Hexamita inflata]
MDKSFQGLFSPSEQAKTYSHQTNGRKLPRQCDGRHTVINRLSPELRLDVIIPRKGTYQPVQQIHPIANTLQIISKTEQRSERTTIQVCSAIGSKDILNSEYSQNCCQIQKNTPAVDIFQTQIADLFNESRSSSLPFVTFFTTSHVPFACKFYSPRMCTSSSGWSQSLAWLERITRTRPDSLNFNMYIRVSVILLNVILDRRTFPISRYNVQQWLFIANSIRFDLIIIYLQRHFAMPLQTLRNWLRTNLARQPGILAPVWSTCNFVKHKL